MSPELKKLAEEYSYEACSERGIDPETVEAFLAGAQAVLDKLGAVEEKLLNVKKYTYEAQGFIPDGELVEALALLAELKGEK